VRILLYDRDGRLKHELTDVRHRQITPGGEFVARFSGHTHRRAFVAARGSWDFLDEFDDPTEEAPPARGIVPVIPGTADPFLSLPNPHAGQLAEAMAVHCQCKELRCPVVLNPASPADRSWWRAKLRGRVAHGLPPGAVTPFRQCSMERGHAPIDDHDAHEWTEGGWPYGPAQHHPRCPRHPDSYNRPAAEEGHPATGGITSADELAPPTEPDPADDPTPEDPEPERGELVRPYVAAAGQQLHGPFPGFSGPGGGAGAAEITPRHAAPPSGESWWGGTSATG
jgi:hypothetical protein